MANVVTVIIFVIASLSSLLVLGSAFASEANGLAPTRLVLRTYAYARQKSARPTQSEGQLVCERLGRFRSELF